MTRASKNYQQRIWEQLHATPNKTSTELGILMGVEQATVSHYLTQLYRRQMVERKHRTFINENARQQTCHEYTALGTRYQIKPIALIPANPRKTYAVRAQERRDAAIARAEKWIPVSTPTPYQPPERPVVHEVFGAIDIESLTVRQARELRAKLNEFFRGAE